MHVWQVAEVERREARLKEVFKAQVSNFREACYRLFGYRVDMASQVWACCRKCFCALPVSLGVALQEYTAGATGPLQVPTCFPVDSREAGTCVYHAGLDMLSLQCLVGHSVAYGAAMQSYTNEAVPLQHRLLLAISLPLHGYAAGCTDRRRQGPAADDICAETAACRRVRRAAAVQNGAGRRHGAAAQRVCGEEPGTGGGYLHHAVGD